LARLLVDDVEGKGKILDRGPAKIFQQLYHVYFNGAGICYPRAIKNRVHEG